MSINEYFYLRLLNTEEEMTELDDRIEEALELHMQKKFSDENYDSEIEGRKLLESLYERRLYIQYMGARTFHPYSEFGRLCLERAQKFINEYESEVGILNTRITKDNVDRFIGVLTEDLIDDISTGRYQAIGAIRYDGDGLAGVGALVYTVDTDLLGDDYILRIKWIFVRESFRRRGIATTLFGSILWKNKLLENENVLVEVPIDKKWYAAYYNMLCDWHFDMEGGYAPQLYLRVSDIKLNDNLKKMATFATSLSNVTADDRKAAIDSFSRDDDRLYKLLNRNIPGNYFDEKLSGICILKGEVIGLLLVHRLPSETVRVEYLGGDNKACMALLSNMISVAKKVCSPDTVLEFTVEMEEIGNYFDKLFDKHLRIPMVMADLQKPTRGENINPTDAAWLFSGV